MEKWIVCGHPEWPITSVLSVLSGVLPGLGVGNRPEDGGELANQSSGEFEIWGNVSDRTHAVRPMQPACAAGPSQQAGEVGPVQLEPCSWTYADTVFA